MSTPGPFEWDDGKADANLAKHGISFASATALFRDPGLIEINTIRAADGEDRVKAIGRIQGRLFTVVFVMRGAVCRIISARRSNRSEERAYADRQIHA
jgi:uncharacterized DUF497 family protein